MQIDATAARIFDEFMLTSHGNIVPPNVVIHLSDWSRHPSVVFFLLLLLYSCGVCLAFESPFYAILPWEVSV